VLFKNNKRKDKRISITLIAHDGEKAEDKVFPEDLKVLKRES